MRLTESGFLLAATQFFKLVEAAQNLNLRIDWEIHPAGALVSFVMFMIAVAILVFFLPIGQRRS